MLALAGVALYTALVPGHIVSQATAVASAMSAKVSGRAAAGHDCHGDMASGAAPNTPAAPKKKYPFCMGYAAFLTALVSGANVGILDAERASPVVFDANAELVYAILRLPQNRGAPVEL
jgi:hypothetical protein